MTNTIIFELDKRQATIHLLAKISLMTNSQHNYNKYNDDGFRLLNNGSIDKRAKQISKESLTYYRKFGKLPPSTRACTTSSKSTNNALALRDANNPHGHRQTYLKTKESTKNDKSKRGLPTNWWDDYINPIVGVRLPQLSMTDGRANDLSIGACAKLNGNNLY